MQSGSRQDMTAGWFIVLAILSHPVEYCFPYLAGMRDQVRREAEAYARQLRGRGLVAQVRETSYRPIGER
jgi:hypothetical protein